MRAMKTSSDLKMKTVILTKRPRHAGQTLIVGCILLVITLMMACLPLLIMLFMPVPFNEAAIGEAYREYGSRIASDPRFYLVIVAVPLAHWFEWRMRHRESLRIDDHGIHYQAAMPFGDKSFSLRWSDLLRIELGAVNSIPGFMPPPSPLRLIGNKGVVHTLQPQVWFPLQITFKEFLKRSRRIERGIEQTDLLHALKARGWQLESCPQTARACFDLNQNKAARIAMGLMAILFAYTIIEFVTCKYIYVVFSPYAMMLGAGFFASVAASVVLRKCDLPWAESIGVGGLLGIMLGLALFSALLRVNAMTDSDGAQLINARKQGMEYFLDDNTDTLIYRHDGGEYWQQFPEHSVYEFELVQGALGFKQINEAPLNNAQREFYHAR